MMSRETLVVSKINAIFFRKPSGLPGYCYFIAWIITVLFIIGGMGMVAAYGISFGNLKTYQWVTAMTVNFFWQIFIESVIKVHKTIQFFI